MRDSEKCDAEFPRIVVEDGLHINTDSTSALIY